MSEHDKQFDDYLDGQSKLSRAYHQLDQDSPSELTDARILAAARKAVAQAGQAPAVQLSRWRRWGVSAALAATVVLAMPLVYHVFSTGGPTPAPANIDFVRVAPIENDDRADTSVPGERVAQQPQRSAVSAAEPGQAPVELADAADVDTGIDLRPEPPPAQPLAPPAPVAGFANKADAAPQSEPVASDVQAERRLRLARRDIAARGALPQTPPDIETAAEETSAEPSPDQFAAALRHDLASAGHDTPGPVTTQPAAAGSGMPANEQPATASEFAVAKPAGSADTPGDGFANTAASKEQLEEIMVTGARIHDDYLDADNWAARIWKQHRSGRKRAARRELGELLQMYPDYELPSGFPLQARQAIMPSRSIIPDAEDWLRDIAITYDRGDVDQARQQLARFLQRYRDYELPNWFPMDRADAEPAAR